MVTDYPSRDGRIAAVWFDRLPLGTPPSEAIPIEGLPIEAIPIEGSQPVTINYPVAPCDIACRVAFHRSR